MSALREYLEIMAVPWILFRHFVKAMRDPQAHLKRVQAEAKAYHDHRVKVSQELGIVPKAKEEIRRFQTLTEALDFVATCLETDAIADLAEEMEATEHLLEMDPGWPYAFQNTFFALKEIHLNRDLRFLYVDREFPSDLEVFELGGPFTELEHKAIGFVRREGGWTLTNIMIYR